MCKFHIIHGSPQGARILRDPVSLQRGHRNEIWEWNASPHVNWKWRWMDPLHTNSGRLGPNESTINRKEASDPLFFCRHALPWRLGNKWWPKLQSPCHSQPQTKRRRCTSFCTPSQSFDLLSRFSEDCSAQGWTILTGLIAPNSTRCVFSLKLPLTQVRLCVVILAWNSVYSVGAQARVLQKIGTKGLWGIVGLRGTNLATVLSWWVIYCPDDNRVNATFDQNCRCI
jgi:hypothetical protein